MIIPTTSVDLKKVLEYSDDAEGLMNYIDSLVPSRYKHIDSLMSNFRYYVVARIHKELKIDKEEKRRICNILLRGIRTIGYINSFISMEEVERLVDEERLRNYMKGKGL